jgi:hypothetical protein
MYVYDDKKMILSASVPVKKFACNSGWSWRVASYPEDLLKREGASVAIVRKQNTVGSHFKRDL